MVFIKKIIYSFLFWLVFATKTGYDKGFLSRKLTTCQASSLRVGKLFLGKPYIVSLESDKKVHGELCELNKITLATSYY